MSNITGNITIRKLNHEGRETWRYTGVVLERTATCVKLEAFFNRDDSDAGYVVFRRGDRFTAGTTFSRSTTCAISR